MEMFLAVAECGGYTSAGERLHISHSAIHRQVGLLEHEVKDRLLVRVNGRMELTSTGKIVLEHARRIRQEISNLQRQIDDVVQMQTGYLRIGTGTMMLQFFLPRVLARFRQEFPGIDVHIMTGTASEVIEDLKARNLDLGIIFRPDAPLRNGMLSRTNLFIGRNSSWPLARSILWPNGKMCLLPKFWLIP